jgi:predicted phage-related endonuclease
VQVLPANAPRDIWLAARRRLICSSDIANIMGVGWADAYTTWAEKTGRLPDNPPTMYQARGLDMEAAVIEHWVRRHATDGLRVRRAGLMRSTRYRRAGATVDRLSHCVDGRCITEAKTQANVGEWGTIEEPEVPVGIQFQGQWQMFVTGRGHIHYVVMGPRFVPFQRVQISDGELQAAMACRAARFWGRYVIPDIPPPASRKDSDTFKRLWPQPNKGTEYQLDDEDCNAMRIIADERRKEALHKGVAESLVARLQAKVGAATEILWPDGEIAATWRAGKTVDGGNAAWCAQHPELVERYGMPKAGVDLNFAKMIAEEGGLPEGLRYRRSFLVKDVAD